MALLKEATKSLTMQEEEALLSNNRPPLVSLEEQCRAVVVSNLERYPPESLGRVLAEGEWEALITKRHTDTAPSTGTGGLDGTGRLRPAVSDRFLLEVEQANPHLSESEVVDRLAWHDCVEYKFKSGGSSRPAALQYPWPALVDRLKHAGDGLVELLRTVEPSAQAQELLEQHIQALAESPMSVALLQASGVGKAVKKFVKACTKEPPSAFDVYTERPTSQSLRNSPLLSPLAQLEDTLQRWKRVAANSGVQMHANNAQYSAEGKDLDVQEDLNIVKSCQSWRDLFSVLQQREEKRRASQGARMRQIRKNLATGRPRVIKVRPTKSRHERILEKAHKKQGSVTSSSPTGNMKMKALRKESAAAALLQKSSVRPSSPKKPSSFGAAVAFAAGSKSGCSKKRKAVPLAGGKQMMVPKVHKRLRM